MSVFRTIELDDGTEVPALRDRIFKREFVFLTINEPLYELAHGHILEKVAELIYDDSNKWYLIYDNNPIKHPSEWNKGDELRIPVLGVTDIAKRVTKRIFR